MSAFLAIFVQQPEGSASFDKDVRPFLVKFCVACHGSKKLKGKVNVESMVDEAAAFKSPDTLKKAWSKLHAREMPPDDAPQPPPAAREKVADWLENALNKIEAAAPKDPGRVVMRRLNRTEFANTIRDLVGVEFNPHDDFPADDIGYGFDNVGDVLSLSPLHLEKYLNAATEILDKAIVAVDTGGGSNVITVAGKDLPGDKADGSFRVLTSANESTRDFDAKGDGQVLIRVRAGADIAGFQPVRMSIKLDGKELKSYELTNSRKQMKLFELQATVAAGKHKLGIQLLNPAKDRAVVVDSLQIVPPAEAKASTPNLPNAHKSIFISTPDEKKSKRQAAKEIVTAFAARAFRRPVRADEVERFLKVFDFAEKQGDSFEACVKQMIRAVLVNPHFLFMVEMGKTAADPGVQALTDYELATRLSYFLWSTMPDRELFDLSAQGFLRQPQILEGQVKRMLKNAKARQLAENFAPQWLQIRRLSSATPDTRRFSNWDNSLRDAMLQEPIHFFEAVFREDRSVLEFLDSDFTFVNGALARHYGIGGASGTPMQRVSLTDSRRGGVLTMAAVLTTTSNQTRTSPVKRGKWVLEAILGKPPPPPLPGVDQISEKNEGGKALTLRQKMEIHRKDPNCYSCHSRMDPIGFGFENYDAIGGWRENDDGIALDTAATLPDGRTFKGPVELKKLLLADKDEFVRCFTEKMMIYALGRGIEFCDGRAIREIGRALNLGHYKFSVLVLEIVKSYPFQYRRARPVEKHEPAPAKPAETKKG